ncbi:MAG: hypothetical protein AAB446_01665 [Patescibacteria group bacterium]
MNNWIPKNKTVRWAVSAVLVSVILYFVGVFVVFVEMKKLENLYNDTESQFSKEEKFRVIKSVADVNQETINKLRSFFIQKGDEVKFIEQIETIAKNAGIKFEIESIDVKTGQENSVFKEDIEVKMSMEGSWESALSFLNKLEKLPFGASVSGVSLNSSGLGTWSGSIKFIIFREK